MSASVCVLKTDLHEANDLWCISGESIVEIFGLVWSWNGETLEESVVLEDLHVSWSEVS